MCRADGAVMTSVIPDKKDVVSRNRWDGMMTEGRRERSMADLVTVRPLDDDTIWRVTFGGDRGNILDLATMRELSAVFRAARATPGLKAIGLEGAGRHFSFGASVPEHLPGQVDAMLTAIRHLALDMLESDIVLIAAVRGQCLGGGLEIASLCHRVVASADAVLGQPEIALGVFAPLASVILPERIRRADAEDLCLTGRSIGAEDARVIGLVDEVSDGDPMDAAVAWARTHFGAPSASSLRLAVRAVRASFVQRFRADLAVIERLYLEELMPSHDAVEGLQAFLEKRPPAWKDA
jgi:cyclohexa-1,5-dienecarbonyl-CoA hydratase